jgi:phage portal protein BeeE
VSTVEQNRNPNEWKNSPQFDGWCWVEVQLWGDGHWWSHKRKERKENMGKQKKKKRAAETVGMGEKDFSLH